MGWLKNIIRRNKVGVSEKLRNMQPIVHFLRVLVILALHMEEIELDCNSHNYKQESKQHRTNVGDLMWDRLINYQAEQAEIQSNTVWCLTNSFSKCIPWHADLWSNSGTQPKKTTVSFSGSQEYYLDPKCAKVPMEQQL